MIEPRQHFQRIPWVYGKFTVFRPQVCSVTSAADACDMACRVRIINILLLLLCPVHVRTGDVSLAMKNA